MQDIQISSTLLNVKNSLDKPGVGIQQIVELKNQNAPKAQ